MGGNRLEEGVEEADEGFRGWDFRYVRGSEGVERGMLGWWYGRMGG